MQEFKLFSYKNRLKSQIENNDNSLVNSTLKY